MKQQKILYSVRRRECNIIAKTLLIAIFATWESFEKKKKKIIDTPNNYFSCLEGSWEATSLVWVYHGPTHV